MSAALDPNRSVAVTASAGTGKTWQLSARIVRLLLEGHAPGRILALTFTRKAAAEMAQRVRERLRDLALADDAALDTALREIGLSPDEALRERARGLLGEVLFAPQSLRATTLHAFCHDLVRRFPRETGWAADSQPCEQEGALRAQAWVAVQERLQAQADTELSAAINTLIDAGWSEQAFASAADAFLHLRNDWRAWATAQSGPLLKALRDALEGEQGVGLEDDPLAALNAPAFTAELKMLLQPMQTVGGRIGAWIRLEDLEAALEAQGDARLEALARFSLTSGGEPRECKPSKEAHKKLGSGAAAHLVEHHRAIAHRVHTVRHQRWAQQSLRITLAAAQLGMAVLEALEQLIRQRRELPFAELEWAAVRLLQGDEAAAWVQYKLDARIDHLLLDEFQDTSHTQWQLLRPLLEEMAAGGERARSVFVVGDPKQSIYRFRRAAPELLGIASQWITQRMGGEQLPLNRSYRSSPAILDLVNTLFVERGEMPDFPTHTAHHAQRWGRVECLPLLDAPEEEAAPQAAGLRNPLTTPEPPAPPSAASLEAKAVAQRLRDLMAEAWAVEGRALSYGDVMILVRQRTQIAVLERVLTEAGIPYLGSARGTLLETLEARDLRALLRWLDSPWRALDLAQVLRSPLFGISEENLQALAFAAQQQQGVLAWWKALQATAPLADCAERLRHWQTLARDLPVHDLLERVLAEASAVDRYEQALPPAAAARVRGNLARFTDLALSVDAGRWPSIARFLDALQRLEDNDPPDEAPPPAGVDAVRILTIHAAKGLEAPAVFLVQAGLPAPRLHGGWRMEWSGERPDTPIFIQPKDERDARSAEIMQRVERDERRESLNLLYVALTRARHFLHISGFVQKNQGDEHWHQLCVQALKTLGAPLQAEGRWVWAHGQPQRGVVQAAPAMQPWQPETPPRYPPPPPPLDPDYDPAAVLRGRAVHLLLQRRCEGAQGDLQGWLEAQLERRIPAQDYAAWHDEAEAVRHAPALAAWFDPARYVRAWNEAAVEGGRSIIDRLVDDGETLWVLDYKTARGATDAQLLTRYAPQLRRYTQALSAWPEPRQVRAGLVLTDTPRWLEMPL